MRPVWVIFDGPPAYDSGRFVEVEDGHGRGTDAPVGWEPYPFGDLAAKGWMRLGPFLPVAGLSEALEESLRMEGCPPEAAARAVGRLLPMALRVEDVAPEGRWTSDPE